LLAGVFQGSQVMSQQRMGTHKKKERRFRKKEEQNRRIKVSRLIERHDGNFIGLPGYHQSKPKCTTRRGGRGKKHGKKEESPCGSIIQVKRGTWKRGSRNHDPGQLKKRHKRGGGMKLGEGHVKRGTGPGTQLHLPAWYI